MGKVSFTGNTSNLLFLGGIIERLYLCSSYNFIVKNCANNGDVICFGVCAHIQTLDGLLENIFNIQKSVHETPSIIGTTLDSLYIGGITGWTYYTTTENCVGSGRLESSETSYIGRIVGVCLFKYVHQLLLLHKQHACKRRLLWQ